ncbi:MAG: dTDP-4-dehydrorhamnose 3,5-epimerase [Rhizobiales bacterium]|nr:dTDP-4-dehydrorhamnose 3,5-epimerase [Hyphomicrobiales bacterium]OJY46481.1 MAG: dTDP-4-dehydrorhamnose 3,5-epimerase [Rhizobiales bacterium 64-17]
MSLEVISLKIPDVKLIVPKKHGDARGFFSETYNKTTFAAHGINLDFVQDNQSFSAQAGTLRGLHYQSPPFAQDKLVRVVRGKILDVAVDIRRGSPTFGKWVAAEISAEKWNQILVPAGFAHGVCTLEPDTELLYKVTNFYSAQHDFGIRWNDPALGIDWPFSEKDMVLSDKDTKQPFLKDITSPF